MSKIDEELKKLKVKNEGKRIKLRYQRNTKTGSISMYLDLSDQQRSREFLRIILQGKDETFKADKDKLKLAINMRDQRENEFLSSKTGFQLDNQRVDFLTYLRMLSEQPGKHESYKHSFMKFQQFCKGKVVYFDQIDRRYCEQFADFLINDDIKSSTANLYFKKFAATLNHAIKNEIIDRNPSRGVVIKHQSAKREFLTIEEIRLLVDTPMQVPDTKNAFLFSCFTGLRLSDLRELKHKDIRDGHLHIQQVKTKEEQSMKLNASAMNILEQQHEYDEKRRRKSEYVFDLKKKNAINQIVRRWIARAGITKHITFHCARHTFATMLLTEGVDIYTVSKLLGHKDIATTQVYAKLVDKKRDEATLLETTQETSIDVDPSDATRLFYKIVVSDQP